MPFPSEQLPRFSEINPTIILAVIEKTIESNQKKLAELLAQPSFTWNNLMQPLEEISANLNDVWMPVSLMMEVLETEELRRAYNQCEQLYTDYSIKLRQNKLLFQAVLSIKNSSEFEHLTPQQQIVIENELRDFHLTGISLPEDKRACFAELEKQLQQLSTKFSENLSKATKAASLYVTERAELDGLPEPIIERALANAKKCDFDGFVIPLDQATYTSAMQFCQNRALREKLYRTYVARASDAGPQAGQNDNTLIITDMLAARHEQAQLLKE